MGGYGHGILSRYPIKSSENVFFDVVAKEDVDGKRNYSRHVLDVNGKELVFYNTHLTLGSDEDGGSELKQVTTAMCQNEYAVLTGDMNRGPETFKNYFDDSKLTVLNGGDLLNNYENTYPQGENSIKAIDNIIISKSINCLLYDDMDNPSRLGIKVFKSEYSDHNAIYTKIQLN